MKVSFFLLLCFLTSCFGCFVVVDFAPSVVVRGPTRSWSSQQAFEQVMLPNLQQMERVLSNLTLPSSSSSSSSSSSCVVVFPEDALFGPTLLSRADALPFGQSVSNVSQSPVLQLVAQMAVRHALHVVLCVAERADDGKLYNAAVAVGPKGNIEAVHRKVHLYYEPQWDAGPLLQKSWFDLEDGTRVGMLICFDGMFSDIWDQLSNCSVVASPSWWVNIPPLCVSNGMHAGMARWRGNVTLLTSSSGTNWFNSGSSIAFPGAKRILQTYNPLWQPSTVAVSSFDKQKQQGALYSDHHAGISKSRLFRSGLIGGKDFYSGPSVQGFLSLGNCSASFAFASDSVSGERYSLVTYFGPYAPHGDGASPLFMLSLCAVVRCVDNLANASHCVSLYQPSLGLNISARFSSLVVSRNDSGFNPSTVALRWITDGQYLAIPDTSPDGVLKLPFESTVSSASFWDAMKLS